jgi:hypothetical protein
MAYRLASGHKAARVYVAFMFMAVEINLLRSLRKGLQSQRENT